MASVTASKKFIIALALVAPLTLSGCGSSEGEENPEGVSGDSTVTSSASEAPATDATEEPAEEENAPDEEAAAAVAAEEEAARKEAENNEPGAAGAAGAAPANYPAVEVAVQPPVEGGQPANQADAAAIANLVAGIYQQETVHSFVNYFPDNTCSAILEENNRELRAMGIDPDSVDPLAGVPDTPLNEAPGFAEARGSLDAVEDIQINGDQASAVVTATSNGQTETSVMRFLRENGRWTMCSAHV